jgi:hypothetical protein
MQNVYLWAFSVGTRTIIKSFSGRQAWNILQFFPRLSGFPILGGLPQFHSPMKRSEWISRLTLTTGISLLVPAVDRMEQAATWKTRPGTIMIFSNMKPICMPVYRTLNVAAALFLWSALGPGEAPNLFRSFKQPYA